MLLKSTNFQFNCVLCLEEVLRPKKFISCAAIKVVFLNVCVCVCSKDMYMLHVCVYFIKCKWHFIFMEKTKHEEDDEEKGNDFLYKI